MSVKVFITVDVEHSIGGAFENPSLQPVGNEKRVYGRMNGKEYGIPLIMDIADQYGIPLTFFVEVFNKYVFGESETREVCQYIHERGHDIQLHLHPNFLNFKTTTLGHRHYSDNMFSYPLEEQIALIEEGCELLCKYGCRSPKAFRAGNYALNQETLEALRFNGIEVDSSCNTAFPAWGIYFPDVFPNDAFELFGIIELPITCFEERTYCYPSRRKPLDLNGVSFREMKHVLENANANDTEHVTIILHSFSFIETRDCQYVDSRPRHHVIRRFEELCRFLANHRKEFVCMTFSEHRFDRGQKTPGNFQLPRMPAWKSINRCVEQILAR